MTAAAEPAEPRSWPTQGACCTGASAGARIRPAQATAEPDCLAVTGPGCSEEDLELIRQKHSEEAAEAVVATTSKHMGSRAELRCGWHRTPVAGVAYPSRSGCSKALGLRELAASGASPAAQEGPQE